MSFSRILILSITAFIISFGFVCIKWCLTLDDVSNIIGVSTPFILLAWFYYSQKQAWSISYFDKIDGIYAGYTTPTIEADGKFSKAGLIFNIRDTDDSGYFRGELDYAELQHWSDDREIYSQRMIEANYTFLGKINFKLYIDKNRHPFKPKENRTYKGTLMIVDRLDFQFEDYKIEDYVSAEYDVVHYREMQTMKFTLLKKHKPEFCLLPDVFVLYKSMGFGFEPYSSVKSDIFNSRTLSD